MFSVEDRLGQKSGIVTVVVVGVHLPNALIDSGATSNFLGQGTWEWLTLQKIQAKASFPYGNTKPLSTLRTITADIMSIDTGATCKTDFVIINGDGRSLVCRETAEKLGLLRLGPSHALNVVNTEADIRVGLTTYTQVTPLTLRLYPRQTDINYQDFCGMRYANEAIVRERQPIPTIEEVPQDLNGSIVFSRVDLKWEFHQILLAQESRHVTTHVWYDDSCLVSPQHQKSTNKSSRMHCEAV